MSISYTVAAMPAATLIQPADPIAHAVYGFAIAPVGFTFDLARKRRVHPFLETLGGIVASTQPIPVYQPNATGLNFFFDFLTALFRLCDHKIPPKFIDVAARVRDRDMRLAEEAMTDACIPRLHVGDCKWHDLIIEQRDDPPDRARESQVRGLRPIHRSRK